MCRLQGWAFAQPRILVDDKIHVLVPEQGVLQPAAPYRVFAQWRRDEIVFEQGRPGYDRARGVDDRRAAPVNVTVLVAAAVGVHHVQAQVAGHGAIPVFPVLAVLARVELDRAVVWRPLPLAVFGFPCLLAGGLVTSVNSHHRTGRGYDYDRRAVEPCDHGRAGMKHVFADEQRDAAVATVERLYALAARKVALLVEHTVGGQVHFAMHAEHAARFEKHARVVETVVAGFLDQAHHQRNVLRQLGEFGHGLARALEGNVGHGVLEPVAGQAELGEHQYVDTLFQGFGDKFFVSFEVGLEVAENRRKLRNCDTRPATGPPYGIFHCLFSRAVAFTAPAAGPLSAFRYQWGSSPLF